jgi:hypothetical protein
LPSPSISKPSFTPQGRRPAYSFNIQFPTPYPLQGPLRIRASGQRQAIYHHDDPAPSPSTLEEIDLQKRFEPTHSPGADYHQPVWFSPASASIGLKIRHARESQSGKQARRYHFRIVYIHCTLTSARTHVRTRGTTTLQDPTRGVLPTKLYTNTSTIYLARLLNYSADFRSLSFFSLLYHCELSVF